MSVERDTTPSAPGGAKSLSVGVLAGSSLAALAVLASLAGGGLAVMAVVALAAAGAVAYLGSRVPPSVYVTGGICLSVFAGDWGYMGLGGLPIKPDRLLQYAGVLLALWQWRQRGHSTQPRWQPVHVFMILGVTYVAISGMLSHTLSSSTGSFELLDRYGIGPYVMFAAAPRLFASERDRDILLLGLTITGAYLGFIALVETLKVTALVLPHFISNAAIGIHQDRARGPFLDASGNGLAMFGCACAASYAMVRWKRGQVFAGFVVFLCAVGIIFTVTRSVWLGSAIGLIVALGGFRETRRWLGPVVAGALVLIGASLVLVPSLQAHASQRTTQLLPVWDRENTDTTAVRMIGLRPLFGWGWNTFGAKSTPYYRQAATRPVTGIGKGVHNIVLSYAVDLGLIGATFWIGALILGVGAALFRRGPPELRPWKICAAAYAIAWWVVGMLGPLPFAMTNILLWVLAGIAAIQLDGAQPVGPRRLQLTPGPLSRVEGVRST